MQVTMTDCTGIDTEIESLLEEIDVVTELTGALWKIHRRHRTRKNTPSSTMGL